MREPGGLKGNRWGGGVVWYNTIAVTTCKYQQCWADYMDLLEQVTRSKFSPKAQGSEVDYAKAAGSARLTYPHIRRSL